LEPDEINSDSSQGAGAALPLHCDAGQRPYITEDKSKVEGSVLIVERWVPGTFPVRHQINLFTRL